ncbi:MAG: hypothetical protein KJS45_11410 [Bacteroidetes bacterium]|nr:hypothetical protein [Bacteroidota bacterium]
MFSPIGSFKKGVESITRLISSRYPYRVAQFIKDNGNKRIESITLYRSPITSVIKKLLTILTLGRWDKVQQSLGYDDLFHLYAVIQFADDTRAIIEKNQDINVSDDIMSKGEGADMMPVDMKDKSITLSELLENTRRGMGDKRYFQYSFRSSNCQDWLLSVLQYNGLSSPETTAFIKQPVDELVKTLPPDVSQLATAGTTTASYVNRVLQALGFTGFADGGMV